MPFVLMPTRTSPCTLGGHPFGHWNVGHWGGSVEWPVKLNHCKPSHFPAMVLVLVTNYVPMMPPTQDLMGRACPISGRVGTPFWEIARAGFGVLGMSCEILGPKPFHFGPGGCFILGREGVQF